MMRPPGTVPAQIRRITSFITNASARKLLRSLVAIESPSRGEAPVLKFIESYLDGYGLKVKRQPVGPDRYNIIVSGGASPKHKILLNSHVDTVPRHDGPSSHTQRRADYVYGRGACDAKGSVAAMMLAFVAATRILDPKQVPVDLCLTVGEESAGDGSLRFVRDCPKYEWAVVGEPTELRIVDCHAGFVEILINATSARSHAFHPVGEQAVIAVADLMLKVRRHVRRAGRRPVHLYVPWIDVGEKIAFWSTRPTCTARLVVNTYSRTEIADCIGFVKTCSAAVEREHEGVRVRVEVADSDEGSQTPRNSPAIKLLSSSVRAVGRNPRIAALPSWTDGARLRAAGIPAVVFGPGSLGDAHTDHERVSVAELRDASITLARTILSWHRRISTIES